MKNLFFFNLLILTKCKCLKFPIHYYLYYLNFFFSFFLPPVHLGILLFLCMIYLLYFCSWLTIIICCIHNNLHFVLSRVKCYSNLLAPIHIFKVIPILRPTNCYILLRKVLKEGVQKLYKFFVSINEIV